MTDLLAAANRQQSGQFLRYLVSGGVAAVANYGSRFLFSRWMPFEIAVCGAFLVGLVVGFTLMRTYAFRANAGSAAAQGTKYLLVNLAGLLQTLIVSSALARWVLPAAGVTTHAEAVAHAVGVGVPVFTSFLAHRALTFK